MACSAILAGCGDSGADEPFSEFTGRWLVEMDTSTLTCPTPAPTGELTLWTEVLLESGTRSDLVDSGDGCRFAYVVDPATKKFATVLETDPYRDMPASCGLFLSQSPPFEILEILPTAANKLSFNLLMPEANMPPRAELTGTVGSTYRTADAAGTLSPPTACSYVIYASLVKFSDS